MTTFDLAGVERVDDVRGLWLDLHHHHRTVVDELPLVKDDELSWERRRALYLERLASGTAFLVLASEHGAVVGYALVCIEQGPDDTFPVRERYAELYSLSVAPRVRGRGIGSGLLDFVDQELQRRAIEVLKVAVIADNADAQRLYERRGLQLAELVLYRFASRGAEADAGNAGTEMG